MLYAKITRDLQDTGERQYIDPPPPPPESLHPGKSYWVLVEEQTPPLNPGEVYGDGWDETVEVARLLRVRRIRNKTAEELRLEDLDDAISLDTVIAQIKAMTNDEFNTWWDANVTTATQAIAILKRVVRVLIRRVL